MVKPWPTDLASRVRAPLKAKFSQPVARNISFSSSCRPDMTEILLKRT